MSLEWSRIWLGFQRMFNDVLAILPNLLLALLVFTPFFFAARSVKALLWRFPIVRQHQHNLGLILGRLAQWGINGAGILVALSIVLPSFKASDLIQLLGIGGVAIGFAFRDILQNFLAGMLLLLTEPFRIGDQIVVRTFEGTVEDIQTRATMIRTYDGRRVVIPNSSLFTESVIVHTAFARRRLEYDLSIDSSDAIEPLQAQLLQALHSVPSVLQEPAPDVLVVQLDHASVKLRARWWITPAHDADVLEQQDRVLRALQQALQAHTRQQAAANATEPLTPATPEAVPGSPAEDSPVAAAGRPSGAAAADR
jgi:small conductance mechanosensitive channel